MKCKNRDCKEKVGFLDFLITGRFCNTCRFIRYCGNFYKKREKIVDRIQREIDK